MSVYEARRAIAESLRKSASEWFEQCPDGNVDTDAWEAMGDISDALGYGDYLPRVSDLLNRLAYLVDRPVTGKSKTRKVYGRERAVCEQCGYGIGDKRFNYCPSCGAEVVE